MLAALELFTQASVRMAVVVVNCCPHHGTGWLTLTGSLCDSSAWARLLRRTAHVSSCLGKHTVTSRVVCSPALQSYLKPKPAWDPGSSCLSLQMLGRPTCATTPAQFSLDYAVLTRDRVIATGGSSSGGGARSSMIALLPKHCWVPCVHRLSHPADIHETVFLGFF